MSEESEIFYSHAEKDVLLTELMKEGIEALGLNVFVHEYKDDYGEPVTKAIEDAISSCDFFVVALTDDAINSQWVQQEIGYAKRCLDEGLLSAIVPIKVTKKRITGFIYNIRPIISKGARKYNDYDNIVCDLLDFLLEKYPDIDYFCTVCSKCGEYSEYDLPDEQDCYEYTTNKEPMTIECDKCDFEYHISPLSLTHITEERQNIGKSGVVFVDMNKL